jgi:hypothetical protein
MSGQLSQKEKAAIVADRKQAGPQGLPVVLK